MNLVCPKCHGQMHQYERHGLVIDQCTQCRGVFLDHGELENLMAAEERWRQGAGHAPPPAQPYGAPGYAPPPPPAPHAPAPHGYTQPGYGHRGHGHGYARGHGHGYAYGHGHGHKKRRSFLEDLFD